MSNYNGFHLDEFAEFLLKRSLCDEKKARFFVRWVRKFFAVSQEWARAAIALKLVLLDLSAAFDTVDYQSFFQLLESHFCIKGQALQLLRSYLDGRTQCVAIENVQSELVRLEYSVPQGSVLGLAKFTMYSVSLGAILRHHQMGYHIYADDTQLYLCMDTKNASTS